MGRLLLALLIGIVLGVIVPWWCSSQIIPIAGGALNGREIYYVIGGAGHSLHWSWLSFGVGAAMAWILLAAAEQRY